MNRRVAVVAVAIVALATSYLSLQPSGDDPSISDDDSRKTTIDRDSVSQGFESEPSADRATGDTRAGSSSPVLEPNQLVFQEASVLEQQELQEWLENQYLASLDFPDAHIRSEVARIDVDLLVERLADSIDANGGPVLLTTPLSESASDLGFNLFPDSLIRASVVHYRRGRHSGLVMASLRSVSSSGNSTADNIYIEITSAGEIQGVVDTSAGFFRIRQTPVPGLVVVSEMDQVAIYDGLMAN